MNRKTAEHLTHLFKRSAPIVRREADASHNLSGDHWSHPWLNWDEIRDIILPIQMRHEQAAQEEEIRAAARERREANSYYCGIGHADPHAVAWHPGGGGFGQILLAICNPEIDAAIATDNARRLAEYEAYRKACEQGVAIPPPEKPS